MLEPKTHVYHYYAPFNVGVFHSLSPQLANIVRFRLDLFVAFTVLLNLTSGRDTSHMCLRSLSPRHMWNPPTVMIRVKLFIYKHVTDINSIINYNSLVRLVKAQVRYFSSLDQVIDHLLRFLFVSRLLFYWNSRLWDNRLSS